MFDTLSRLLPLTVERSEARLKGVAGFTGTGQIRYAAWSAGHVTIDADLRGVAGLRAELHARGDRLANLSCNNGVISAQFDSRKGGPAIALAAGDRIEILQNGQVILRGVLRAQGA